MTVPEPVSPETVEALAVVFRAAWHEADERGASGERVTAGLTAVFASPAMHDLLADTARAAEARGWDEGYKARSDESADPLGPAGTINPIRPALRASEADQ